MIRQIILLAGKIISPSSQEGSSQIILLAGRILAPSSQEGSSQIILLAVGY